MKKLSKLAQIIKDNPGCHIYYHDNGAWTIYKSKKAFEQAEQQEQNIVNEEKWEDIYKKITLIEGDDYGGMNGYASPLVEALAELLSITVDSI